ncbi:hypothetical protein X777_09855 [Ooceraea biroi]|uniref:Uncharacterized protein n=1 Tax=Ooceraea biroi TaxID=2015173 RepID=A0A026W4D2_OOCBI|nr:hypothetical protein X777_09855 [Ooceraea biroi]
MPDYTRNEIVDILLVLGECRDNYRAAAQLYRQHSCVEWLFDWSVFFRGKRQRNRLFTFSKT